MKEIYTEIEIQSTPEKIWDILTDFDNYPEWNPFIISIRGKLILNSQLFVYLKNPDSKPMQFQPKVVKIVKNESFSWIGRLFFKGIFDGHHQFELTSKSKNTTLFIHKEQFSGILVSLFWNKLQNETKPAFIEMNTALKIKAEHQ